MSVPISKDRLDIHVGGFHVKFYHDANMNVDLLSNSTNEVSITAPVGAGTLNDSREDSTVTSKKEEENIGESRICKKTIESSMEMTGNKMEPPRNIHIMGASANGKENTVLVMLIRNNSFSIKQYWFH